MRKILLLAGILALPACSMLLTTPEIAYQPTTVQNALYDLQRWAFEGRIAITGKNDAWSANINWEHTPTEDLIKLSGPLGQGGALIQLNASGVTIDQGGGDVKSSTDVENFINQQVGLAVPVNSLRYWVVGLPDKSQTASTIANGFEQVGWKNQYKTMQPVNSYVLPRNMTVTSETVKLKLFIDQWILDDKRR
ncbi:MAG: lipoprotein insertase outer membrane protein LolB [Methylococcales bacterium]|nr:lipoprotein insertase outer membrane protein LolB [Methylococcales bacterium]